jgi:hypothetical protein
MHKEKRISPLNLRVTDPSDEVVPAVRACKSPKIHTPPKVCAVFDRRAQRQLGNRRVALSKTQLQGKIFFKHRYPVAWNVRIWPGSAF